jgi:hypothetical protein
LIHKEKLFSGMSPLIWSLISSQIFVIAASGTKRRKHEFTECFHVRVPSIEPSEGCQR